MVDREELQRLAREVEALRQQFDEIQNRVQQIDGILEEHDVTDGILEAYMSTTKKAVSHVPIGSGVCLKIEIDPDDLPVTLVDIGSGIYGEKNLEDARAITQKRKVEINELRNELHSQGQQIEQKLGEVATLFNTTAEQFKSEQGEDSTFRKLPKQSIEQKEADEDVDESTSSPKKKRGSLFRNELTLDD
ncbi:MAG: prefoldin subunit alpha [Candidatus Poseidoniales archaeon]